MAQQSESRALDKVIVRLPDGMRERIKAEAERNNRSMNAEIVAALEEAFPIGMSFGEFVDRLVAAMKAPSKELREKQIANVNGLAKRAGLLPYGRLAQVDGHEELEIIINEGDQSSIIATFRR